MSVSLGVKGMYRLHPWPWHLHDPCEWHPQGIPRDFIPQSTPLYAPRQATPASRPVAHCPLHAHLLV